MFFFQNKLDRVLNVKAAEENRDENTDDEALEKGDLAAMMIAAFLVLLPILLVIAAMTFGIMWIFIR